jgi:hypothetical protein
VTSDRSLKFSISKKVGEDVFPQSNEDDSAPDGLYHGLLALLGGMQRLESFHLNIPEHVTDRFAEVFSEGRLYLPGVKTLVVGSYNAFIINHCPNVETVTSNEMAFYQSRRGFSFSWDKPEHAENMIDCAGRAPKLVHFEMTHSWWAQELEGRFIQLAHSSY